MALKIKLKRVDLAEPTTSDLEVGEVGINTSNNQLFVNNSGTIVSIRKCLIFQQLTKT